MFAYNVKLLMKLVVQPYTIKWKEQFSTIAEELKKLLGDEDIQIDHIGSTAVEGLSAKPIIDIQLGVKDRNALDGISNMLQAPNLVYYEKYNEFMPQRRFFVLFNRSTNDLGVPSIVKLKEAIPDILHNHDLRIAHIHVFIKESEDWLRHIAFRDYLRNHPKIKNSYQSLKELLGEQDWKDGNDYNAAKDDFLKKEERKALAWYKTIKMKKENVNIQGAKYDLYINYQDNEGLRLEFNRMTEVFWEFDFENYYKSGHWDDNCIIYSLFVGNKIVSHTTVSLFQHAEKKLLQLGTVMTDEGHQKKGLSRFLMERIALDFKNKVDGMFLFANDTVLDFYPRFGFSPVTEYAHYLQENNTSFEKKYIRRQLDLENPEDMELFETLVNVSIDNSSFQTKNKGLAFFYCYAYPEMGYKEAIYYVEELNCVIIAQVEEGILSILEIFSPQEVQNEDIIHAFADVAFCEVVFGFTPKNTEGLHYRVYKEEDLQLFVSPELQGIFESEKLRINALSHT